ncbi:hypothetical protein [Aquimarina sp. 2201CG5-10]|uniref:hypothetical protein n=1 Tax=Aquimarina callyspongiae TaxID=3098150 RepID=UPI002AB57FA8|nr:hypothetical protein [Aquimarina sp. 2201CG5-10]MDY8137598.1 hypothetical protein [Aquimarina sp. 2201CG5-10]
MNKAPSFSLYAQDFLTGVMYLTNEEIGIYIKMLCKQWTDGKIPKKRLGFLVGLDWDNLSEELKEKFEDKGEYLINTRLEEERQKKSSFLKKQSDNGKKGGRPAKKGNNSKPKQNPNQTQKKPLEKEDEKEIEKENVIEDEIENSFSSEIFEEEFTDSISDYFLQTTEAQKMKVNGFLKSDRIRPQIENFKIQTKAYAEYKELTGEKIHNWLSYQTEWDREDWVRKLERERLNNSRKDAKQNNQSGQGPSDDYRRKTAERLGIIQPEQL